MNTRPKRTDSEKDILEMQRAFLAEKAKNPSFQPAAGIVKPEKVPKKSIFARNREKLQPTTRVSDASPIPAHVDEEKRVEEPSITNIVLGDVVEKEFVSPKATSNVPAEVPFPKVERSTFRKSVEGKSIFALSLEAKKGNQKKDESSEDRKRQHDETPMEVDCEPIVKSSKTIFGGQSFIVEDSNTANTVHNENMEILSRMKEEDILIERQKILESLDPALLEFIAKKRKEKMSNKSQQNPVCASKPEEVPPQLPEGNPAVELLKQSSAEQWIHFDIVEKDKLEWMRDIPRQVTKLNAAEPYEARFDWKGVLLPYSEEESSVPKDDRELYLHGDEPFRPGYTLQELFRLARSNVIQQRVSAFTAVGGILSIYQQGFYDSVLELPIAKIFFLLRFGLDENAPVILEVVSKSLALLFYNETDETLLDFIYENVGCYWQPILAVREPEESDDPMSLENLQRQMQNLRVTTSIKANVQESEEESKASMTDFQLAETDLIECLLRSNIIQRIYFILTSVKPDNSTVTSCLKLLIRIARTSKDTAVQIINYEDLMRFLFTSFLPGLQSVDTSLSNPPFYDYPQHLVLKLCRVLISQSLSCALKLLSMNIVDRIQNYLFNQDDIKSNIIRVQIESLRVFRCLMLLRSDTTLYRKFLPAFRYMLEWHHHHVVYEKGGSYLLRQHASALLCAITSGPNGFEVNSILGSSLVDVCCNWFYRATQCGVQEFTQSTLLTSCLGAVSWFVKNNDIGKFREFIDKYLKNFLESSSFVQFEEPLNKTSILLRSQDVIDRRHVYPALPNVGAILMNDHGPQVVVPQAYCVYFLTALWRLTEQTSESGHRTLTNCLVQVQTIEPIVELLKHLSRGMNTYLTTNFFAKCELKLLFQLLCFDSFREYVGKEIIFRGVYNFLCGLCAEHIPEIERLFEKVIFNTGFLTSESQATLDKWRNMFLEVVYPHYVVVSPTEVCLSMPSSPVPILSRDWPYSQLKMILEDYVHNVHQSPAALVSEREVVRVTLSFTSLLENESFQITSPTEKLMYLMITFMGPDSQFLDPSVKTLLQEHICNFYKASSNVNFEFDQVFEGKCKFQNLYALFVDHFQAASYGDNLFSSMVLVPLAQKYDNKWRRMVWSEHVSALRYLNCDESLLIGGIDAYLNPPEEEESLIKCYTTALHMNLVRPNSVVHRIAQHHVDKYKERHSKPENGK